MARSLWVYKCKNDPGTENLAFGDWGILFARPWRKMSWGGAWATAKLTGKVIFDEEIEVGDLILAWQTDKAYAVGLCEVVGWKASQIEGRDLVLRAVEEFDPHVRLHHLKRTTHPQLASVQAFKPGNVATIYRTTASEATVLLSACGAATSLTPVK